VYLGNFVQLEPQSRRRTVAGRAVLNAQGHVEMSYEVANTATSVSIHIENSTKSFKNRIPATLLDTTSDNRMLHGCANDEESKLPETPERTDNNIGSSKLAKHSDTCILENIACDSVP
jgi:hypothetical protein